VNTEAFIEHLAKLMVIYADASLVRVFADNAAYVKNKSVFKFVKGTNFYIEFLPTYAPNLNIIERLWKKMKEVVKANKYLATFKEFMTETIKFLSDWTSQNI
jgi:transposase